MNLFRSPVVIFKTAPADLFFHIFLLFLRTTSGHVNIWSYVFSSPISQFVVVIAKSASILFMIRSDCLSIHTCVYVCVCVHVQSTKFLLQFVCIFSSLSKYMAVVFFMSLLGVSAFVTRPHR